MSEEKQNFYELQSNGTILWTLVSNFGTHEINLKAQGNIFETSKEADRERDRRNLLHRIKQFRYQCQGNWEPDWNRWQQLKFCIFWNNESLIARPVDTMLGFNVFGYFKEREDCLEAIGLFGHEIKRLYVDY